MNRARGGASVEWAPQADWILLVERFRAEQTHFVRAGVRWSPGEDWSVDLSRTQRLSGPGASDWTLGATWAFPR